MVIKFVFFIRGEFYEGRVRVFFVFVISLAFIIRFNMQQEIYNFLIELLKFFKINLEKKDYGLRFLKFFILVEGIFMFIYRYLFKEIFEFYNLICDELLCWIFNK